MKIENFVKPYWARKGPNHIFGSNWQTRLELSDEEACAYFDQVWQDEFQPSLHRAKVITADQAKAMIPNDGRRKFFKAGQEHRELRMSGEQFLLQIDKANDTLTQMWHTKPKPPAAIISPSKPEQEAPSLQWLADQANLPLEKVASIFAQSVTAALLRQG